MHDFFFFNDTATTEIYTLSLHDALPICLCHLRGAAAGEKCVPVPTKGPAGRSEEHTSELQSRENLVCRLLLEKKKSSEDADTFEAELNYALIHQLGAFNSPVWFNCVLFH